MYPPCPLLVLEVIDVRYTRGFCIWVLMVICVCTCRTRPACRTLKLMYYNLLIRYHEHHNSYIDICRCYRSIYEVDVPALDSRPVWASCCAR